jgi:hypothetical protein
MSHSEEFMDRHYQRKYCVVCNKLFWVRKRPHTSKRVKCDVKPHNTVVCCRKCSLINMEKMKKIYRARYKKNVKNKSLREINFRKAKYRLVNKDGKVR